jgi:hypothetical protein
MGENMMLYAHVVSHESARANGTVDHGQADTCATGAPIPVRNPAKMMDQLLIRPRPAEAERDYNVVRWTE